MNFWARVHKITKQVVSVTGTAGVLQPDDDHDIIPAPGHGVCGQWYYNGAFQTVAP